MPDIYHIVEKLFSQFRKRYVVCKIFFAPDTDVCALILLILSQRVAGELIYLLASKIIHPCLAWNICYFGMTLTRCYKNMTMLTLNVLCLRRTFSALAVIREFKVVVYGKRFLQFSVYAKLKLSNKPNILYLFIFYL